MGFLFPTTPGNSWKWDSRPRTLINTHYKNLIKFKPEIQLTAIRFSKKEIADCLGTDASQIYAYFNYTPGTYWLHCHFVNYNASWQSSNVHACFTLENIIQIVQKQGNCLDVELTIAPLKLGPLGIAIYYFVDHGRGSIRNQLALNGDGGGESVLNTLISFCDALQTILAGDSISRRVYDRLPADSTSHEIVNKLRYDVKNLFLSTMLTYALVRGDSPCEIRQGGQSVPIQNKMLKLNSQGTFDFVL